MTMVNWIKSRVLLLVAGVLLGQGAFAQGLDIDIVNGTASALPIAVVPFGFEGASVPPASNPGEIIRADLARSGQFRTLAKTDVGFEQMSAALKARVERPSAQN